MARRARQHYLDANEFREALLEAQSKGEPTVRVCELFRLLISRYLSGPRYSGYDAATLEDLASAALEKCIRNIKGYNPAKKSSPFSYYTMAVSCSVCDSLGHHYKAKNIKRELANLSAAEWEGSMPVAAPMPLKKNPPPDPLARKTETSTRHGEVPSNYRVNM